MLGIPALAPRILEQGRNEVPCVLIVPQALLRLNIFAACAPFPALQPWFSRAAYFEEEEDLWESFYQNLLMRHLIADISKSA